MKKYVFILALVLLMVSSLVSGTLAMYTTRIDNLAEGGFVAKEFIFTSEGADSFKQGVKIAPSEKVNWQFKVKNHRDQVITETDLYYKLTFHVSAAAGKRAIDPLAVTVRDTDGNILKSVTGAGAFDITGSFPQSQTGQEKTYTVEINWPGDGDNDINYAGGKYGSALTIDAIASQVPLDGNGAGEYPQSAVSVGYETTAPWANGQSGNYQYNYRVTITNNTDLTIKDWKLSFSLPTDRINEVWSNAKLISGTPDGTYAFGSPNYNNASTDTIQPGQSVTFGGNARGRGTEAVGNVTVSGSNIDSITDVQLSCEFGKAF